jgi:5-formyltetrahydrofolate cyclo-ligase
VQPPPLPSPPAGGPSGAAAGAAATKAALRTAVRAARRARTPHQRAEAERALATTAAAAPPITGLAPGAVVAAYASWPTEPGTGALRAALRARGLRVLLPVTPPAPGPLTWVEDEDPARPARDGLGRAAVVLLPALAVDGAGSRLGQGGGHYDRTLAALPTGPGARPLLVAVVHEEELLAPGRVPREAHDARVDAVLTPGRWVDLAQRPDPRAPAPGGAGRP